MTAAYLDTGKRTFCYPASTQTQAAFKAEGPNTSIYLFPSKFKSGDQSKKAASYGAQVPLLP